MEFNKYNINLSNDVLINYYNSLIKDFFKILPIFEGRDAKTKSIIYCPEEAYIQYRAYLLNFIYEICGAYHLFNEDLYFLKLLNTLEGMYNLEIQEHSELRSLVFHCIDICKKMIIKMEGDGVNGI